MFFYFMTKQVISLIKNHSFQKFGIYGFGQAFNLVTPLLVVPYIISVCGVENYGKTAVAIAIAFFLIVFVDFGSDMIGTKDASINRHDKNKLNDILSITYGVKFLMLLSVLSFSTILLILLPFFSEEKPLYFLTLLIIIGQCLNPTWFLQGVEHIKTITFANIFSKLIYLAGVFFTVKTKSDYIFVNFWWGIGMIVSYLLVLVHLVKVEKYRFLSFSFQRIIFEIKNNFKLFSSQIFVSLQLYAPILIIGFFGNAILAGQYRIIEQLIIIFKTYLLLFFNFIFPKICYLHANFPTKVKKNWLAYNGLNFLIILFLVSILFVFSPEVINYFSPDNPKKLVHLLQLALFLPLILGVSIPLKQLILAKDYERFYANTTIGLVLLSLFVMAVLLSTFQLQGVFLSLIIAELLTIFFYIYRLKKSD